MPRPSGPPHVERPASKTRWNAALALASALAAAAAVEFGGRRLCAIPQPGYAVWSFPPGSRVKLVLGPDRFEAMHRYNRYGFRGPDFPPAPARPRRVACIGDSYTEGLGAREDEAWPAQLGRLARYEALNLGRGGADPALYGRILCEAAAPLRPTDVIVCWLAADLRGGPRLPGDPRPATPGPLRRALPDPFHDRPTRAGRLAARLLPGWTYLFDRARGRWPRQTGFYWPPWSKKYLALAVHRLRKEQSLDSAAARYLANQRLNLIEPKVLQACRTRRYHALAVVGALVDPYFVYRVTAADMGPPLDALQALTRRWVEWYAATCRAAGARAWLLYFPEACLVQPGPFGPTKAEALVHAPRVLGDTSARDLLAAACRSAGVPFIDAMPALRRHAREKLYHRYDTHPTARAYRIVAEVVARRLRNAAPAPR